MNHYQVIRPFLFLQDPETVHNRFVRAGRLFGSLPPISWILQMHYRYTHPALEQRVDGIHYRNPVGLSAGFDKECVLMRVMPNVGFGFEEVGSITAKPYGGNPKPRLKRLPQDKAIIVNYGLKNTGARELRKRLRGRKTTIPIGVSVAKTNTKFSNEREMLDDWIKGIKMLRNEGDYLTINLSCPNTYDPRNWCDPRLLKKLLARIKREKITFKRPVYLKLAADLTTKQVDAIIADVKPYPFIKGFIVANLVKDRSSIKLKSKKSMYANYKGGISGIPVRKKALPLVRYIAKQTKGKYTIIGCGGIFSAKDAYAYITAGASLVQLITGMIYEGPGVIKRINAGLVELLQKDGFNTIAEAVGSRSD